MKKIFFVLIVGLFLMVNIGAVSAFSTYLKVYEDQSGIPTQEVTLNENDICINMVVELHKESSQYCQWYRWIGLDVYDSNDRIVFSENKLIVLETAGFYVDRFYVKTGDYRMHFHYDGNLRDDWLPSSRDIILHVK